MKLFTNSHEISVIDQFQEHICSLTKKYKYVYTSFGSKLNEPHVSVSYPRHITFRCNALYQMVPEFLRILSIEYPILVIIIDDFNDKEHRIMNMEYLEKITDQFPNIDLVILDEHITISSVIPILNIILNYMVGLDITSTQCIFSNFIRFRQPNKPEMYIEQELPGIIQKTLDEFSSGIYDRCFYQWYGYSYFTYNYMYCYKTYNIGYMMYINNITKILMDTLKNNTLSKYNKYMIDSVETNNKQKKIWAEFTRYSIDITS